MVASSHRNDVGDDVDVRWLSAHNGSATSAI
jgi:hypothetical protein